MSVKHVVVTTSWDDGHKLDLQLAALLKKYGLRGTFYVSPDDREFKKADRLNHDEIKQLAKDFEIGAHTMTHPRLTTVTDRQAYREISNSKQFLEDIIGQPVTSFCYPGGDFDKRHPPMVKKAGFKLARTVERFHFDHAAVMTMPTTVHAYRHWSDLWKIAVFARFHPVKTVRYTLDWSELAIALFEKARVQKSTFHLWGHSWEIDNNHDWQRLERVFAHIGKQKGVRCRTNGELV